MAEKINTAAAKGRPVVLEESTTVLTAAQILTLNASPITLVRAAASEIIVPYSVTMQKPVNTVAYAGIAAGEDLSIEDTNSLNLITVEATGFLDQLTEQYRYSEKAAALSNKATGKGLNVRLKMLAGEITTGNGILIVTLAFYRVELGKQRTAF